MPKPNLLFLFFLPFLAVTGFSDEDHLNLDKSNLALNGYDPVAYFSGQAIAGKTSLTIEYKKAYYRFASESNKKIFEAEPEKHLPQYGGWCAYAMLDSDKVGIDPESYKIIDGKLYLFYNGFWGDTLKKWNQKLSKQNEAKLIEQAEANWQEIVSEM